jgi:hypothetical protein
MFGFKLHRSKPRPISAFEYFGYTGTCIFRLPSVKIAVLARADSQRHEGRTGLFFVRRCGKPDHN